MNIRNRLSGCGKKTITVEELADFLKVSTADIRTLSEKAHELVNEKIIEPVKASGKNGNHSFPYYKKYRILIKEESAPETVMKVKRLHPVLLKSGYLSSNLSVYEKYSEIIEGLNRFFFFVRDNEFISRKERSFQIFGHEKYLDDSSVKSLLVKLKITAEDLKFYDTPEYCFHDYIPERKEHMTLLVCENKDIWFGIRRLMFEYRWNRLFGTEIDGVVYGCGNKVSQSNGALLQYVRFMGDPDVKFLYWGDIDREGFDIFRRTCEVNPSADISLFIPGYRKMIGLSRGTVPEDSPSDKKAGMIFDDLFTEFTPDEREFLNDVLKHNKLIPQEIIPFTKLSQE